jgi:DNA-binding beta-propeller fold protein YncE
MKKFIIISTALLILSLAIVGCGGAKNVEFVTEWGTNGTGEGQFMYIEDFSLDAQGNVLATDALKRDVQVFSPDGELVAIFGPDDVGDAALEKPEGVAVDDEGYVFVADYLSGYVQKYDQNYNHLMTFSGFGSAEGETAESEFMDIGHDRLYLAEAGNNRISVFDLYGEFLFTFGAEGTAAGQMIRPEASKVASDGTIFVADYGNHRVQVFTKDGEFIRMFAGEGTEPGQFRNITGIALDKYDNVYTCDLGNNRIQVFDKDGNFLYEFGEAGTGPGQFDNLHGLVVDDDGNIYIADTGNNRIQKFKVLNFGK